MKPTLNLYIPETEKKPNTTLHIPESIEEKTETPVATLQLYKNNFEKFTDSQLQLFKEKFEIFTNEQLRIQPEGLGLFPATLATSFLSYSLFLIEATVRSMLTFLFFLFRSAVS